MACHFCSKNMGDSAPLVKEMALMKASDHSNHDFMDKNSFCLCKLVAPKSSFGSTLDGVFLKLIFMAKVGRLINRSSRVKNVFLEISQNPQENTLCQNHGLQLY